MKKIIFGVFVLFILVGCEQFYPESYEKEIPIGEDIQTEEPIENASVEGPENMTAEREVRQIDYEVKNLEEVEITEYEGEKLDDINDVLDVSIKGPQHIDIDSYTLEVSGLVEEPQSYTYDEVLSFQKYSKVVKIQCVMGWSATVLWEGVLLKDIFDEAGIKPQANTAIFYAYDGYTTSLPLDYIIDNDIIIADKINNMTLDAPRGYPFELVAENKYGYKWIKWITKIELSDDEDYRGYWESRGYSNKADIS